jgi:hypothetical protein
VAGDESDASLAWRFIVDSREPARGLVVVASLDDDEAAAAAAAAPLLWLPRCDAPMSKSSPPPPLWLPWRWRMPDSSDMMLRFFCVFVI